MSSMPFMSMPDVLIWNSRPRVAASAFAYLSLRFMPQMGQLLT